MIFFLINGPCNDRHSVEMEILYRFFEYACPVSLLAKVNKDLIQRPFEVKVKILVKCISV